MARPRKPPRLDQDAKTGQWQILYHDGARDRRRRTGTSSQREAEAQFRAFLTERSRPERRGLQEPHEVMVGDLLAIYADEKAAGGPSAKTIAIHIGYLADFFGDILVSSITPATIKGYCEARRCKKIGADDPVRRAAMKSPGDSTLRRELVTLVAAMGYAVKNNRLTRAPIIALPPSAPRRDRWCTPEEVLRLLEATKGPQRAHLRMFILLALATAGRRAALTEMRWVQVDLVNGEINLNPPGRAQTTKGRPRVPLDPWMLEALQAQQQQARTPFVIEFKGERVLSIAKGFRSLAASAGMPDITPHVLRHTVGTWAAQAGKPIGHIAWLLGHSETATTEIYKHQHPDFIKDTVGSVTDRMGWRETGGKRG